MPKQIEKGALNFERHFAELPDPRVAGRTEHKLLDIVVIAICGYMVSCDDWIEIADWAEMREEFFRSFLELPNGIPSHDTFRRVFGLIEPKAFEQCFRKWMMAAVEITEGQVIAVDGKELRRSARRGKGALRLVSAWATANGVMLAQVKVDEKSNEISALPQLFEAFRLKGSIITADAMHCQTETTRMVTEGGGDYILALKGNQKTLSHAASDVFARADQDQFTDVRGHTSFTSTTADHGREETRQCDVITDPEYIQYVDPTGRFIALRGIVRVRATRRKAGGKPKTEERFYITSLLKPAAVINQAIRAHWQIENSMHYILDVAFREDERTQTVKHGAENMALLRRIVLSLLAQETSGKHSFKVRRKMASWSDDYLLERLNISF